MPVLATAIPTQEFSPKVIEATLIASTETTPFAFKGVSILFTAPYTGTCQIYQVAGKKLLTTGGDCYAVLPANNVLWGKIIGASLIGPLMPTDDFTLPNGVMQVKKITTTADGFGITPESTSGMTQVAMLKVKMNGEIWPLMVKIQVGVAPENSRAKTYPARLISFWLKKIF